MGTVSRYRTINHAVLELVCQLYSDREFEQLDALGISHDLADRLIRQNQLVINRLSCYKQPLMQLMIDTQSVGHLVEHLEKESERDRLINNLIIHGAPSEMITSAWGCDETEYFRRKRQLSIRYNTGPGRMRKSLRNKEDEDRITRFLKSFQASDNPSPGWRLLESSESTGVSLHLVWIYMKEHLGNVSIGEEEWLKLMNQGVVAYEY